MNKSHYFKLIIVQPMEKDGVKALAKGSSLNMNDTYRSCSFSHSVPQNQMQVTEP